MVQKIAVPMADLSGFTALTKTHSPATSAVWIERYIEIAENCLVGDNRRHERKGNAIKNVSDSPEILLATALSLPASTARDENILQVHEGLNFGEELHRAEHYFDSTISLVSRIAAKALPAICWYSVDFKRALEDTSGHTVESMENYWFKNVKGSKAVFELQAEKHWASLLDPSCRMSAPERKIAKHCADNACIISVRAYAPRAAEITT